MAKTENCVSKGKKERCSSWKGKGEKKKKNGLDPSFGGNMFKSRTERKIAKIFHRLGGEM